MATISEALAIAIQHHQAGRLQAAEQIYRQILAIQPNHADAWHLLGVLAHQAGKHEVAVESIGRAIALNGSEANFHSNLGAAYRALLRIPEAVACYRRAVELKPDYADAHNNLGVVLSDQGKLDEAILCYRRALDLKPDYPEAHNNLGSALKDQGKLDEAIPCFRRALELKPGYPEAHNNLGNALKDQGNLDEAAACYRRALHLKPDHAKAHYNLGNTFKDQGKLDDAVASLRRALELKPDFAEAYCNLGLALDGQGKLDDAIACYRRALELKPDFAEVHYNLGVALNDQGKPDEALAHYRRALELKPDYAEAQNNLGNVLRDRGNLDEAVVCYRRALERKPDYADVHCNLGNAFKDQGKLDEAAACYRRALELKPDFAEAHADQSLLSLLTGDFQGGWAEYEWRWRTKELQPRDFPQALWDGQPLEGRTILLHAEQGLGDAIQFVRYAALVKRLAGTVILECRKPLLTLLATCPGVDQVVGQGDELPAFATHAPLLSLPRILRTSLDTIPAAVPYLFAAPASIEYWRETLREVNGYKIGINWQGRPGKGSWLARNIPLQQFATLAEIPGVRLISLQTGAGCEELAQARERFPLVDLGDEVVRAGGAFMDTAAIMMNLDLVITSDTSVPHLAGSLGVPVWVAIPFAPGSLWLLDRSDSPWYPTMRLFRQKKLGDWADVFEDIKAELCAQLRSGR